MKHLSLISAILFALLFTSCSKDEVVEPTQYGKLAFSIKSGAVGVKSTSSLGEVTHAIISIKKGGSIFQDFKLKKIKLTDWGSGNLVSDEIKLWVGSDYRLTRFELQNKDNKTLYAAPLAGSALASKVSKPLDIAFGIDKDKSTPLQVEVLSVAGASPAAFGFVQFNVKVVTNLNKDMIRVEGGTYDLEVGLKKSGDKVVGIHYNVTLDEFYIGKYEVTQAQWLDIMGTKPKGFVGGNLPISNVSKAEVLEFIKKLNAKTGESYRLPTEAEWIYAARGGKKSKGYSYAGGNELEKVAWYKNNSGMKIHPVGQKLPNELGIYDMTGNVWEWCSDTYADTGRLRYDALSVTNPKNSKGDLIVSRGGAFNLEREGYFAINILNQAFWHGSNRNIDHSEANFETVGFRLVKSK